MSDLSFESGDEDDEMQDGDEAGDNPPNKKRKA